MPEAEKNLKEILEYGMENWGLEQALLFMEDLRTTISVLLEYPQLGPSYHDPKLDKDAQSLRSLVYKQYRIVYETDNNLIRIIAILPKGRPRGLSPTPAVSS